MPLIFLLGEQVDGNFQLGVDLVDDRAGAAGALVVHRRNFLFAAGFFVVLEDDDLGVLPAEFDDRIDFGVQLFDGERNCGYFLHEFCADLVGDRAAAGAGHEHAGVVRVDADFGFHALQEFKGLFRLLGFVALIVLPESLIAGGIDDHRFHRGRADVEPDQKLDCAIVAMHGAAWGRGWRTG